MTDISSKVKDAGSRAEDSSWLDHLVRAGLVAYGVVHLLIAWVALQLAWGGGGGGGGGQKASSEGAFKELASSGAGTFALWAVAIGLVLLVVWRLLEAAFGHDGEDGGERLRSAAGSLLKAVLYGALAFTAFKTLLGDSGGGGKPLTAQVLALPGGQVLVVLAGLAVVGYGGWTAYRGWSEKFLEHLDQEGRLGEVGTAYKWFGKVGYLAKGLAIVVVGGLVVHAGWTHEGEDEGLGDALQAVLEQPFGPALLTLVAAGIACYGLFCFARARHLDR